MGYSDGSHRAYKTGKILGTVGPPGPPGLKGIGYKLNDSGNCDIQNKKLTAVGEGVDNQDAVNKHQMEVGLSTKPNKTDVVLVNGQIMISEEIN